MIKSNLFEFVIFSIFSYLCTVGLIFIFSTKELLKFILVLMILVILTVVLCFLVSGKFKEMLVTKSSFFDIKIALTLIIAIYLIGSLYSLYLGAIFMERVFGIDIFSNSNSILTKLFLQNEEMDIGTTYFIYQMIWFGISYLLYTLLLKTFNTISIVKNDGFHLNDSRIVKPLLKWFTLFIGIVAIMGIGVNFISHDNFVYDTKTDSLYRIVEVNYEINRIEKLTQEEFANFNSTYILDKTDPTFNFFMFSLLFFIPYIHLIFKND